MGQAYFLFYFLIKLFDLCSKYNIDSDIDKDEITHKEQKVLVKKSYKWKTIVMELTAGLYYDDNYYSWVMCSFIE